jgi:uncharacterized repeat protein (TIGR03943 family)
VRVAVLAIWTATFVWLWVDGATIYVGPRTAWIVPFGTIALGICTAVAAWSAVTKQRARARPSLRDLAGFAVLLAPIVAVLLVDSPQLGANAAQRKGQIELSVDDLPANDGKTLDLVSFVAASQDPDVAQELGLDESARPVAFPGIVTGREDSELEVTRFKIYCCAADAIPYTATVDDSRSLGTGLELNDWVYVRGAAREAADGTLIVRPQSLQPVEAPLDPYL